eukprot:c5055_g1_i1.p1 GENE.c5055_g1_i1~~c5055_g1_i1.p1  ORF type:complete len:393 (-),score=129.10 c5055_g1_i1:125-1273(-)
MAVDLDQVFAYKTIKMVRVLDRRLGFVFYGIQVMILIYIFIYVFAINKGYLESEQAIGQVHVKVMGATYSKVSGTNVAFDAHDLRTPSLENGALFIATKIEMVKQSRKTCPNPEYSCAVNGDCPVIEGISSQECEDGRCVMAGWCPGISPDSEETSIIRMERPEDLIVWFRSAIAFPKLLKNGTFSSMSREDPVLLEDEGDTDAWTLDQLLDLAGAPLSSVKEDGAMLDVRLEWDCYIDTLEGCTSPKAYVQRLDEGKVRGFSYYQPHYVHEPNLNIDRDIRILQKYTGVRILVASKGYGRRVSPQATILQLSSGLALLSLARIATDLLMLKVMPEKEHYRKYKEELTPDFSDLRDKVLENEGQRQKIRGQVNRYKAAPAGV